MFTIIPPGDDKISVGSDVDRWLPVDSHRVGIDLNAELGKQGGYSIQNHTVFKLFEARLPGANGGMCLAWSRP